MTSLLPVTQTSLHLFVGFMSVVLALNVLIAFEARTPQARLHVLWLMLAAWVAVQGGAVDSPLPAHWPAWLERLNYLPLSSALIVGTSLWLHLNRASLHASLHPTRRMVWLAWAVCQVVLWLAPAPQRADIASALMLVICLHGGLVAAWALHCRTDGSVRNAVLLTPVVLAAAWWVSERHGLLPHTALAPYILMGGVGLYAGLAAGLQVHRMLQARHFFVATQEVESYAARLRASNTALHQMNQALTETLAASERQSQQLMAFERELNMQAVAKDKEKSKLLGQVVHDLRQPVQAIVLSLTPARRKLEQGDQAGLAELLDIVSHSAGILSRQMSSLLQLTKLEAGVFTPKIQPVALAQAVRLSWSQHEIRARKRGVRCEMVLDEAESVFVPTDPTMFHQIVDNLIANAIKYADRSKPVPPFVRLRARVLDGQAWISVQDNGVGIAAEHLDKGEIFKPYFQGHNELPEEEKGVGLGLSIVAAQIALLPGHALDVQSQRGEGATFSLRLPTCAAPSPPLAGEARRPARTSIIQDRCIWVVEDHAMVRESMGLLLRGEGAITACLADTKALAELLSDTYLWPDVIISDFHLPQGETVHHVIQMLEVELGSVPLIVISGDDLAPSEFAADAQVYTVIRKPVDTTTLLDTISHLLAQERSP